MWVDVQTEPGFAYADPTRILEGVQDLGIGWPYDVTPDGGRLLVMQRPADANPEGTANTEIRVTLNWFEELRQRVPR